MSTPRRAPGSRSAFAAAFLSLLFPGLGHAYAGAYMRALGFAAAPLLVIALGAGVVLRSDKGELLGFFANQPVLIGLFVANVLALLYRIVAAVDAWRVARFLNAGDASGDGRVGRARLPVHPLSIAGLLAVLLVMSAGHLAVARYNVLALDFMNCVFTEDGDASCDSPADSPDPGDTTAPTDAAAGGESAGPSGQASPSEEIPPTPGPSAQGTLAPTLPPWDGTQRLNVLMVGVDASGDNTDTMIVVSVDPVTKQVAMFQVPRDVSHFPVPANARGAWGATYDRTKINRWFFMNRNRTDLWRGSTANARGFNALKAMLGELYGLDIRYYVKVDFTGFRKVVDTLGGVQINVQMPVYEDRYPAPGGALTRVYIPAGPQHMNGTQALIYARSRHNSAGGDFDRGRRQQRVLLSLREQMSAPAIIANLPTLLKVLGQSVKTDIPRSELSKLLALAESVDTKNIRSFVFSPPYYGTEDNNSPIGYIINPNVVRIRRAVKQAFTVSPDLLALRDRLGAEAAGVWVLNASGKAGLSVHNAEFLAYNGVEASAPNQRVANQAATTKIVVYNGAEAEMPETVKYLEDLYHTKVTTAVDPKVTVDMIVTLGRDAPDRTVDAVG